MCRETGKHGSEAETGGAIPSPTVTGRPTAQAFWGIPGVFSCGPQLTGSVRLPETGIPNQHPEVEAVSMVLASIVRATRAKHLRT